MHRDLHCLAERVARIKGALGRSCRPTNGTPAPSTTPPETTAE